jgi:N-acetylglutamate synthase-like GNAT family acetyltransferase
VICMGTRQEYESKIQPKLRNGFTSIIPTGVHVEYAAQVSQWTMTPGEKMLRKTPEQMLELFQDRHSTLIMNDEGELMSHAAATFIYSDGTIEVGAVYTAKEHRKKGAASEAVLQLVRQLKKRYPGQTIFALANPFSAPMFEKMGAEKMEEHELSSEVWEPCNTCESKPARGENIVFKCCDTPYNLTNVVI